jgi:HAD superfamily hydrolase (TIGR01509 family)
VEAVGIAETFQRARESLQCNKPMLEFLHAIKRDNRGVKIYAMTNISAPEWELLRRTGPLKQEDWNLFEQVFTSCEAHERKPNLGFYRRVLEVTGVDPIRTLFVDDKLENVLPAQSFGMHGIVYTTFEKVSRKMRNLLREDPVGDGNAWIRTNAKRMPSMTNTGAVLMENFAQLLILELTGERELVDYMAYSKECNFFQGDNPSLLTLVILLILCMSKGAANHCDDFPCDLDTTSIALTIAPHYTDQMKYTIMDKMLQYKNLDDVVQTYFDPARPRIGQFSTLFKLV